MIYITILVLNIICIIILLNKSFKFFCFITNSCIVILITIMILVHDIIYTYDKNWKYYEFQTIKRYSTKTKTSNVYFKNNY